MKSRNIATILGANFIRDRHAILRAVRAKAPELGHDFGPEDFRRSLGWINAALERSDPTTDELPDDVTA
ncbi:MAG TPA: hypothetical protein VI322_01720 [Candidatus Saccharimonadia bacterium]